MPTLVGDAQVEEHSDRFVLVLDANLLYPPGP